MATLTSIRRGRLCLLEARAPQPRYPAVLFVHGYLADAREFEHWLPLFAERGFPAYAVHLRGRAGSEPSDRLGHISMADFVEDARTAMLAVDARFVVGHSMGGLIAQCLVAEQAADAAVLISPAPPRGISVLSAELVIAQLGYLPALLCSGIVRPERHHLRKLVMNRVPAGDQDVLLDAMRPDSGRAGREMSLLGVPVDAARVHCPLLILAGQDDRFIPCRVAEKIAARYGVSAEILPRHGHMIPFEPGWQAIVDQIADWLAGIAESL
jgi:non-heme chloroperoxidase